MPTNTNSSPGTTSEANEGTGYKRVFAPLLIILGLFRKRRTDRLNLAEARNPGQLARAAGLSREVAGTTATQPAATVTARGMWVVADRVRDGASGIGKIVMG